MADSSPPFSERGALRAIDQRFCASSESVRASLTPDSRRWNTSDRALADRNHQRAPSLPDCKASGSTREASRRENEGRSLLSGTYFGRHGSRADTDSGARRTRSRGVWERARPSGQLAGALWPRVRGADLIGRSSAAIVAAASAASASTSATADLVTGKAVGVLGSMTLIESGGKGNTKAGRPDASPDDRIACRTRLGVGGDVRTRLGCAALSRASWITSRAAIGRAEESLNGLDDAPDLLIRHPGPERKPDESVGGSVRHFEASRLSVRIASRPVTSAVGQSERPR